MRSDGLDFVLPPELIAQIPSPQRSACRLLHYRRATQGVSHRIFSDLPGLLRPGDLLVFNDAEVIAARFTLRKNTGGRVEGLFIGQRAHRWRVLLRDAGSAGDFFFDNQPDLAAKVLVSLGDGEFEISIAVVGRDTWRDSRHLALRLHGAVFCESRRAHESQAARCDTPPRRHASRERPNLSSPFPLAPIQPIKSLSILAAVA